MEEILTVSEERHAKLDWAFNIITQFMIDEKIATLYSKEQGLVVTDINDAVLAKRGR